jgi:cysteine sulfinate desulfinase/cysteine desulfurase-like protein
LSIHFEFIDGEALVIALDLKGLAVSIGAAYSSRRRREQGEIEVILAGPMNLRSFDVPSGAIV